MTEEEFLKEYKGKFIKISSPEKDEDIVWMFDVQTADFSKGNGIFTGWVSAKRSVIGYQGKIEVYKAAINDELILRPQDKITVFKGREELEKDIQDYLSKLIDY